MKRLFTTAGQILLAVIVTVVTVLGVSSVVELKILKQREVNLLQRRGNITADRISNSLANPLWNLDRAEVERVVRDELAAQEVARIEILDEKGQSYIDKIKTVDGSIQDAVQQGQGDSIDAFTFNRELRYRNNRIGSVRVDVSTAYLENELQKLRWGIALKLLLLVLVLSVVLYVALRRLVVRPISLLRSRIENDSTQEQWPRFRQSIEFNSLAEAFSRLSERLDRKRQQLEIEHAQLTTLNAKLHEKIHEREQAEAALRETEMRFRELTDNIDEVLWLNTPNYDKVLFISPAYERVWGRTRKSLQEDPYSFLDAVHPEDREWVEQRIRAEKERGFSLEYRIVQPGGAVRWIWDRGFPIRDLQGVVVRIAGISEDITERRQAQEELLKYADQVRDLYNNAPCGYHSLDADGYYVQVNDTELEWMGYTREEVIGKLRFTDILTPESLPVFEEKYPEFKAAGSSKDVEYQIISKDGTQRSILLSATASVDADGNFVMSRATLYDITARRRAEELVERSEEKFARSFRSSPVGLAVTRMSDGMFIEVNDAAMQFLGYGRAELIGNTTFNLEMWLDLKDRQRVIDELNSRGSVRGYEINFRNKEGRVATCDYSAELIEVEGEKCLLSVLLDITARRQMEQELKANEELLRLFVKHTPAAIAMFDNEMRYLQVSDRFLKDYQIEGRDIIGQFHYDVFPDIPERWKAVHKRILAGAVERSEEDPYIEPDGTPGWLQWESLPWRKADGEIGGLILFTQVITQRKRAEKALRSSEERFAKIFNLAPYRMGIVRMSDGVILDVNDCWLRDTGFTREETVNKVLFDLDQWLTEASRNVAMRVFQERKPVRGMEGVVKTKSGETRYALSSVTIVDFDGEPCYLWAANDITERKYVEEEKRHLIHDLGERVKELTALHQTARILQDEDRSVNELLHDIVTLLPTAWQYPEICEARIRFGDMEFKSPYFAASPWSQVSEFSAGSTKGEIEVVYLEERPAGDIGPFLFEERNLIDSIGEMISSAVTRRYAQEALQQSEAVFRTLAESVSAGIYIYRDATQFIYVNRMAEQLTGYSKGELLQMGIYDLIHPSFRDLARNRVERRSATPKTPGRYEDMILTKDGEERWMDVTAARTVFQGEPAVIVTTFDITARKRAEEELLRSEERYRTLFETAPNAVSVFDPSLHLMMTNELGASLYGYEQSKSLIGRSVYDFIAPEDRSRAKRLMEEMQRSGKLAVFEVTGIRHDKTKFDLETRATLIPNVEGHAPSVLTVKTDITERKRAEKALKNSEEQLRALSGKLQSTREEEGTRIAREIHDELGGALTGLKWDLEGIDAMLEGSGDSVGIFDVRRQIGSMIGLIESTINTVRRISSELRPGVLDDLGLVAAIEWQAQQFQKRTGLKVHWQTDLDNADISREGATAVFRIFQEVLTNVLRHSRASNIYVKLLEVDDSLELEVVDDGRGITEDEQKNTRSLGLLGMKERALLVGGQVSIRGARGKGTTVVVSIPLSKEPESKVIV